MKMTLSELIVSRMAIQVNSYKEKQSFWIDGNKNDTTGVCRYCGLIRKTKWMWIWDEVEVCYKCFMKIEENDTEWI